MTTSKQVKDWLQLTIDRRAGRTPAHSKKPKKRALSKQSTSYLGTRRSRIG